MIETIPVIFDLCTHVSTGKYETLISHAMKQIGCTATCKNVHGIWLAFDFNGVRSWNCHAMLNHFNSIRSFFIRWIALSCGSFHFQMNGDSWMCKMRLFCFAHIKVQIEWDFGLMNDIDPWPLISTQNIHYNYGAHLVPNWTITHITFGSASIWPTLS